MLLTAKYVLPVSSDYIEDGAVVVRDDQIVAVGSAAELRKLYPNEQVVDYGLAAILPGFIDCHTHLEYSALRGLIHDSPYAAWKFNLTKKEHLLSTMDWEDSAGLGVLEACRSGITSIADITDTGASFRAALQSGLRGLIYRETGTMDRKQINYVFDQAVDDIKSWRNLLDAGFTSSSATTSPTPQGSAPADAPAPAPRLRIGIAPTALYKFHPQMFSKLYDFCKDGTPLALHLAGSQEEFDFIKWGASPFNVHSAELEDVEGVDLTMPPWLATGVSPVNYVLNWGLFDLPNVLAVHCVHVDDDDIAQLAERDIHIAVCSRCNAQLAMGIPPITKFLRAGIEVGLGTDSPAATDTTDMIAEMRIGMLIQRACAGRVKFITAHRMLYFATLGAARALRIDDVTGSLEVGKQADIIAIDLSNSNQTPTHDPNSAIVNTATQDNVLLTMVGGRILYDGQHRSGLDVDRILARAEEIRQKLRAGA